MNELPFGSELMVQMTPVEPWRRVRRRRYRWLRDAGTPRATSEEPAAYAGTRRGQLPFMMTLRSKPTSFPRRPERDARIRICPV